MFAPLLHAFDGRIMILVKGLKTRLDLLLVARRLVESREKAQALILAGQVLVDEQKVDKCGAAVSRQASVRLLGEPIPYVGRAGLKLAGALDHFGVDPRGRTCLDIGSSTGGFTDCLLQREAARVIAIDAGTNQLDWKLRQDPRVELHEQTNARYLTLDAIGSRADLVTIDVSFISVALILPVLPGLLEPGAEALVLVKPQFEVGRRQVGKGGVVRDERLWQQSVDRVSAVMVETGFTCPRAAPSILPGAEGNREFFLHALWKGPKKSEVQNPES